MNITLSSKGWTKFVLFGAIFVLALSMQYHAGVNVAQAHTSTSTTQGTCSEHNGPDGDHDCDDLVGSITICKAIENASGTIVDGSDLSGATFSVPGISSVPSSTAAAAGTLPTSNFTTPLSFNVKLFGASVDNAQCVTYDHLDLGHYYYGEEQGAASSSWATPLYNDQDTVAANSPSDFFSYSGQLFDGDPSNDGARNMNADGDIYLIPSRYVRTLIVLNKETATTTPPCPTTTADLTITKTADVTSTTEGGTVNYTLTVTALGPATSTGVVATDTLPSGLTFVNATASKGSYASSTGTWTIGDLTPSSTATLDIAATANAGTASSTISNTAIVGENASTTDPNPGNNSSTIPVVIVCTTNCGGGSSTSTVADLLLSKTVDNANPAGGDTVTYTISVTAQGPATSTFVNVTDILPSGLSLSNATASQGTYNMTSGDWDIGTLGPNATATLEIAALVGSSLDGTTVTNTATISELSSLTNNNATSSSVAINVQSAPCTVNCGGGGGGGGSVSVGGGGSAYTITIDGGASSTATTSATLSLYGTGAYTMELSNTPDFASSTWEPYATTHDWTLLPGGGTKTVYVKYRSVSGTDIGSANDSIELLGPQGQVLGTSTTCGLYLTSFIKLGANNDPNEVKKLQTFLNENLGINLPVTGFYGQDSFNAVEQFQVKYHNQVLAPWVPYGLATQTTPTGYVYKTTRRWINMLVCPPLGLPIPPLP